MNNLAKTLCQKRQVGSSKSLVQKERRSLNFTGDRTKEQQFLIIGDRLSQSENETIRQVCSLLENSHPHASILTVKNSAAALLLIEENQPDLIVVIQSDNARFSLSDISNTTDKLIEDLLASKWCPNILVLSQNILFSPQHQTAIESHRGGFVVLNDKSLFLLDLTRYVNLAMKGLTYLPQAIESALKFHPNWMQLLHLRFELGFNDLAIAQTIGVSDRTIRNYWRQIQDTFLIDDDPHKDLKVLIGIEARRIGLIGGKGCTSIGS